MRHITHDVCSLPCRWRSKLPPVSHCVSTGLVWCFVYSLCFPESFCGHDWGEKPYNEQSYWYNFCHFFFMDNDCKCMLRLKQSVVLSCVCLFVVFFVYSINGVSPKVRKILQLFRLLQIHNGVFIKLNKATINMLRIVQPYVAYG